MKSIFMITALALSLLSGCCCNTYSNSGCSGYNSCQCTDPYCGSCGSCMSAGKCCEYFGNVGNPGGVLSDNWDSTMRVDSTCQGGNSCNSGRIYNYRTTTSVMYR